MVDIQTKRELLELLEKISREIVGRDYITLFELLPKVKVAKPDWSEDMIREALNELKQEHHIRITGNFEIRVRG